MVLKKAGRCAYKRMANIKSRAGVVKEAFAVRALILKHVLRNLVRRTKPVHIIICGQSRSGTTLFYNMIRAGIPENSCSPPRELRATKTLNISADYYVTKRPLDLFEIENIQRLLGKIRDLKFIIMIRDPRALVTSKHASVPEQYWQGYDYKFFVNPNRGIKSYTNPGIGAAFTAIRQVQKDARHAFLLVKYEEVVANPDSVQTRVEEFTGVRFKKPFSEWWTAPVSEGLQTQLNGIRPVDPENADRWRKPEHRRRIALQWKLFPELDSIVTEFVYASNKDIGIDFSGYNDIVRGLVVAMHTPDPIYKEEADRLKRSLDAIGVKYSIDEVPSVEELAGIDGDYPMWFIQKLARFWKPTWLVTKRKLLRGPLLYTDADSFVHNDPWTYLNQYDGDVGVFIRRNGILNSSVIWINDNENAMLLLKEWAEKCDAERKACLAAWPDVKPSTSDQPILQKVVELDESGGRKYKIQRLPESMVHIFDRDGSIKGRHVYIEQLQASRVARSNTQNPTMGSSIFRREKRIKELDQGSENILL